MANHSYLVFINLFLQIPEIEIDHCDYSACLFEESLFHLHSLIRIIPKSETIQLLARRRPRSIMIGVPCDEISSISIFKETQ
jgi:hypothetical protein